MVMIKNQMNSSVPLRLNSPLPVAKGPYPLGDLGKIGSMIGGTIGSIIGRRLPILPWVWLKIAGRSAGDRREIIVAGQLVTADLYQTYLIFHR